MNDPARLVELGADDFERALLRSSRDDAPSAHAYQKTLTSVGLGVVVPLGVTGMAQAATAAAPVVGAKLGSLLLMKLFGAGAAIGFATVLVAEAVREPLVPSGGEKTPAAAVAPAQKTASEAPEAAAEAPSREEPEAEPAPEPIARATNPVARTRAPLATAEPALPEPVAAAPAAQGELEGEVRALDTARRALAEGQPRAALALLDEYVRAFPSGVLTPEARVLRVRALLSAGDRLRAESEARAITEAQPNGQHAAVVRALLERGSNP